MSDSLARRVSLDHDRAVSGIMDGQDCSMAALGALHVAFSIPFTPPSSACIAQAPITYPFAVFKSERYALPHSSRSRTLPGSSFATYGSVFRSG